MIEHLWSILCQNCLVDKITNTISLIEVVEDLSVGGQLPATGVGVIPIRCSLVSSWERRPADQATRGTAKFRAVRPTGESDVEQEYSIDLSSSARSRTIAKINGITFRELGMHIFEIYMKDEGGTEWTKVAAIPINIKQLPPPESNQP